MNKEMLLQQYINNEISEDEYRKKVEALSSTSAQSQGASVASPEPAPVAETAGVVPDYIAKKLNDLSSVTDELKNKIKDGEEALESVRASLRGLEKFGTSGAPLSKAEIEELILNYTRPLEEKIEELEVRLVQGGVTPDTASTDKEENEKEGGEDEEVAESTSTPNDNDRYKAYDEDEVEEEERERQNTNEDDKDLDEKPKMKGWIKALIAIFVTFGIMIAGGYIYVKKRKAETAQAPQVRINPINANTPVPASERSTAAQTATAASTIDPKAVASLSAPKTATPKAGEGVARKTTAPKTATARVSADQGLPQPSYAKPQKTAERSPIEKELLGDSRRNNNIPFMCRLKAKYPQGAYVYYVKNENGSYGENPKEDTFIIEERSIVYNYSPENEFVKLDAEKYIKSKIFAVCKPVKQ